MPLPPFCFVVPHCIFLIPPSFSSAPSPGQHFLPHIRNSLSSLQLFNTLFSAPLMLLQYYYLMASLFISLQMLLVFTCVLHAATVTCAPYHDSTPRMVFSSTNTSKHNLRWVGPMGRRVITVDANGGGHFRSVQAAVNAVPDNNRMNVLIQISAGCYMYCSWTWSLHFLV